MLKEIVCSCTAKQLELFSDLVAKHPVSLRTEDTESSESKTAVFEEQVEGGIGAQFFSDMRQLLEYSALFESIEPIASETKEVEVPTAVSEFEKPEDVDLIPMASAVWQKLVEIFTSSHHAAARYK